MYSLETTCHNSTKRIAHIWLTAYATLHFAWGNESCDSSGHSPKGQCFPGIFSRMAWSSSVPRCPKRWASCRERQRSLCWSPEVEHKVGVSAVHSAGVKWGATAVSVQAYVQNESLDALVNILYMRWRASWPVVASVLIRRRFSLQNFFLFQPVRLYKIFILRVTWGANLRIRL